VEMRWSKQASSVTSRLNRRVAPATRCAPGPAPASRRNLLSRPVKSPAPRIKTCSAVTFRAAICSAIPLRGRATPRVPRSAAVMPCARARSWSTRHRPRHPPHQRQGRIRARAPSATSTVIRTVGGPAASRDRSLTTRRASDPFSEGFVRVGHRWVDSQRAVAHVGVRDPRRSFHSDAHA